VTESVLSSNSLYVPRKLKGQAFSWVSDAVGGYKIWIIRMSMFP
jgi:hypothetical protein